MSQPARVDPFASLEDFAPAPVARPKPEADAVRKASEANNFVSRAPAKATIAPAPVKREQRRYRSGRNLQINFKATATTLERLTRLCDATGWTYAQVLEKALDALEANPKDS